MQVQHLLNAADEALRRGHREAAWALSQDAQRGLLPLLNHEERRALAISIRNQAEDKLAQLARGKSVAKLLEGRRAPTLEALTEAVLQIDISSGNQMRKDRIIRHEFLLLMGVLLATTIASLLYMYLVDINNTVSFRNRDLLVLAPLFGILGASLSSIQRVASRPSKKVPQQRAAMVANAIRLGTGAGASLVVLAGLQTAAEGITLAAALLACFAGGFSERFILRFVPEAKTGGEAIFDATAPPATAAVSVNPK